ncbi:hypothetical protein V492_04270 [Pseudogymnoascus sp. VKM F-4246]|nr:hypothetical protein V492_04270 [Pseudogymnoascus sp. VKM F-4246]
MSSLLLGPVTNTKSPSRELDTNHVPKQHGIPPHITPKKQYSPSTLYELPPSANVLRAMGNHNHKCAVHGRRRAATSGPSPPTMPLVAPAQFREPPIPPGVVRATSIGSSGATRQYRSRRSAIESLEETFYDCQETSVGFLTPSLNQSHSDPPIRDDDDPTEDRVRVLCCYLPKIHLPRLKPIPCLGFSLVKSEPMIVNSSSHAARAELPTRAWRRKSASVATDEAMRFVESTEAAPITAPGSMSVIPANKLEPLVRSNSTITVCRNALFSRGRRTGTVSETFIKRNSQGTMQHQMEVPTIVTLRRAIAVLNILIQPGINAFSADMNNSAILREYRRSIRSMALPSEYLITSEEIKSLTTQIGRRFIAPTPRQTALVRNRSLIGPGWKGNVKKSSSGSVAWFGAPRKTLQSRAALSVSNIHTASKSILSHERRSHFVSHVAQRTSIISMLMTGKSLHELAWEDDGKSQNLFSSTWTLATNLAQGDLAAWSRNSYRTDPNPASIEDKTSSYGGGTAITGIKRTFKTAWEHQSKKASDTLYDINKSLTLSEVKIPSYVTQQFSICIPKPISDGVWLPPISTFKAPLVEIPAANLRPSVLDPSPTDRIWKDYHVALNTQPKHPLLGSPVGNDPGKPELAAPATILKPKPSLWGLSTRSLVRVPVGSRTTPSLWSSDVAASGQMTVTGRNRDPTAESTPKLWKRASARRLRSALGMGSGESWRRVAGVENMKDAEVMTKGADDRIPWGAETLDDVSIISEDLESDGSWKRDARSRKGKKLFRRISQKAGRTRDKLIAAREQWAREEIEDKNRKEDGAESDCPSDKTVVQRGTLPEKSKYDELEELVTSLRVATPVLRPRDSRNYMNLCGTSRVIDQKVGDDRPLKPEGGSRRSVSVTTIV